MNITENRLVAYRVDYRDLTAILTLGYAATEEEWESGTFKKLSFILTPEQCRQLGEELHQAEAVLFDLKMDPPKR